MTASRLASALGLISFVALLLGTAAAAGLERIDAYRLNAIGVAPCIKRVLGFEFFEAPLWWVSLCALSVALVGALIALVLLRNVGKAEPSRRSLCIVAVAATLLLILVLVAHGQPFDFDDSTLPMCGATSVDFLQ